jgi:hypothetical protein
LLYYRDLDPNDKFVVIASDGVFEFLTNQMVADECARHNNPLLACKSVVAQAYHLWLQYEVRTDDITMMAIYFDEIPEVSPFSKSSSFYVKAEDAADPTAAAAATATMTTEAAAQSAAGLTSSNIDASVDNNGAASAASGVPPIPGSSSGGGGGGSSSTKMGGGTAGAASSANPPTAVPGSTAATGAAAGAAVPGNPINRQVSLDIGAQRPVRRVMSREKRKHMIELHHNAAGDDASDEEDLTEAQMQALIVPKSEEDKELIGNAIKSNFLFQHLNSTQRTAVINVMKEVVVKAGSRIIRQGDRGDQFYLIASGRFEVRVKPPAVLSAEEVANESSVKENGVRGASTSISVDRAPSAAKIAVDNNPEALGNVVHVYESNVNSHPGFGELSLMCVISTFLLC